MEINNFRDWYSENEQTYDNLTKAVIIILSKLFNSEGLTKGKDSVLIDSRLKPYRSFNVKINKKDKEGRLKYSNPTDITDLAGLRVVGYILSDIDRISTIVKGHFDIDTARSTDKSKRLGKDKIGFRGVNYVSSLREELIDGNGELEKFKGLHFEIQVTSLLDFAWSQIEHDRNYKTGVLISEDTNIPRRILILSGLLEIADNEFESLSKEVDRYAKTFWQKIDSGEEDTQINPSSLRIYLRKFDDIPGFAQYFGVSEEVLEELKSMGINTLPVTIDNTR